MATQYEIGEHLGITQQQVSDLQRRNVLEKGCTIDKARKDYLEHLRSVAAGRGGDAQFRLTEQRARQAEADAQLKELQYWREVGALVAVDELEPLLSGWATSARAEVENAVDRAITGIESEHGIKVDRAKVEELMGSAFNAIADFPRLNQEEEENEQEADADNAE